MLEQFPGRTLEELDQIDLNRVLRAKAAKRYEVVEARRKLFLAGKVKGLDAAEWATVQEMDAAAG